VKKKVEVDKTPLSLITDEIKAIEVKLVSIGANQKIINDKLAALTLSLVKFQEIGIISLYRR